MSRRGVPLTAGIGAVAAALGALSVAAPAWSRDFGDVRRAVRPADVDGSSNNATCLPPCAGGCEHCTPQGSCAPFGIGVESPVCSPYLCSSESTCPTSCVRDSDCVPRTYCRDARCIPQQDTPVACDASDECLNGSCGGGVCRGTATLGAPCVSSAECASAFCVDAVCCDQACSGQCQACDVPGQLGTCSPVIDAGPHADRASCPGAGGPCAGVCRGDLDEGRCTFPTDPCARECADASETDSFCNAEGACAVAETHACTGNLNCGGGGVCLAACASHADCAPGSSCDAGVCRLSGATCDTLRNASRAPDGGLFPCGALLCDVADGLCPGRCTTVANCVAPGVCDPASGACVAPPATFARAGGCGCEVARGGEGSAAALALAGLGAALARRRRSRAPARLSLRRGRT